MGSQRSMKAPQKKAVAAGLALLAGAALLIGINASPSARITDEAHPPAPLVAVAATAQPSRVDYQQLHSRIDALMQDPDMVGLAVGTIENGQVRFLRGYGETVASSTAPVTPDTVFRWASLSKGVAAALVVGLAEDGKLSLDTPVRAFDTTLSLPGDARDVRVSDILSHRVGLVRNAWDDRLEAGEDPKVIRSQLRTLAPFCQPATCYTYQNVAFDTVTEIVERVSGEDYAAFARHRIFAPLAMRNASLGRTALESAADWARPHHKGKTPTVVDDNYYRVPAAGGVNGSIRDLVRWMEAQTGSAPAILSPAALATMHQPVVSTPPRRRQGAMDQAMTDAAYGLGWRTFTYAGRTLVGHRGSVDGYGALILFDPVDRSGIAMLWNSNNRLPARLQLEFFDMLYGLPFTDWLALEPQRAAIADATTSAATEDG